MNTYEIIGDIQRAQENNKLIVFVGAGVSKNSNVPLWSEIIKKIAKKLDYDNCKWCEEVECCSNKENCSKRYNFSSDEYLKIPQYYYDSLLNKSDYFNLIESLINIDSKPNAIDNAIIEMTPKHIITTNYDHLIENTPDIYTKLYAPIRRDIDLLCESSDHYVIKMHGDLNYIDKIVLREDDYLQYSQTHPLIELFIKSLLVDHVFLFVGYSLNDYNLKIIMSWIDYIIKNNHINTPAKKYLLISKNKPLPQYEINYWNSKEIYPINTFDIPKAAKECFINSELTDKIGKEIYASLKHISDENYGKHYKSLQDILLEKYSVFDSFNAVSFRDLLSIHKLGQSTEKIYTNLYVHEDIEKSDEKPLLLEALRNPKIGTYFYKAGITKVLYREGHEFVSYDIMNEAMESELETELFSLYLNNDYENIIEESGKLAPSVLKAYYLYISRYSLGEEENAELASILEEVRENLNHSDYWSIIQLLFNQISVSKISISENTDNMWNDLRKAIDMIPKSKKKCL